MTVYYVCCASGSDQSKGSESMPFRTIQAAANVAQPGDTVLVQPGIYRERVSPVRGGSSASLAITFRSAVPQKAIIRGSVPWVPEPICDTLVIKDIYSGPLDLQVFQDSSAVDGANPFLVPCCVTPYGREGRPESVAGIKGADPQMVYSLGQVFVDDRPLLQCPYKTEMEQTADSWYYDISANRLYANIPGGFENIEVTNQRRVFAPHVRGLKYIVVDGFVIERCGNQYPNKFWTVAQNQQAGMIGTRSGRFWTIQNNIIRHAAGVGIDWGNEGGAAQDLEYPVIKGGTNGQATGSYGHVIKDNILCDNGAAGTASFMGKCFTFSGNTVERNNAWRYYGKQRWESAGVKVHCPTGAVISKNVIRNNYCHGIWSDQGAGVGSYFSANLITENQGNGINFEIGSGTSGKVLNNIFDANEYNISFVTSGGCLVAHNLFLGSHKGDIETVSFTRPDKWDSLNVEIYYNLFMNSATYLKLSASSTIASRFLNYNQYGADGRFVFCPDSKIAVKKNLDDWRKSWTNGANYDEASLIREGGSGSLTEGVLTLDVSFVAMPFVSRTDIIGDYSGTVWTAENCVAGPFCGGIYINPFPDK
jgi:hypothetical protein